MLREASGGQGEALPPLASLPPKDFALRNPVLEAALQSREAMLICCLCKRIENIDQFIQRDFVSQVAVDFLLHLLPYFSAVPA